MFNLSQRFAGLGKEFYSQVVPEPLHKPHLIHLNHTLAESLDLGTGEVAVDWVGILSGLVIIKPYEPSASLYAGHQFGVWVPQLGDGRAMLIAEHLDHQNNIWELQTKGGGRTPFSRGADGRAVLRSSIREYLCSHAMAMLGVTTTKALAIVGSDTPVYREQAETAAVILRVAPSFIRFGNFEVFANRNQLDNLSCLAQFVLNNYYPECKKSAKPMVAMYGEIINRTALMVAKWQALGFCHGVMNTDNMSILGLTLDYGPFGFMDGFDPRHICNHSDYNGRYAYQNQPYIAWWNLARLGESLLPIIEEADIQDSLATFSECFSGYYLKEFGNKLGISDLAKADLGFVEELLNILAGKNLDWTIFWRQFSYSETAHTQLPKELLTDANYIKWLDKYHKRVAGTNDLQRQQLMLKSNPVIVPRNYMLQNAIVKAEAGDFSEVDRLFKALSNPYAEDVSFAAYYAYPPEDSKAISVSCSS